MTAIATSLHATDCEDIPHGRCGKRERVGKILRRMRRQCESDMTHEFSPGLSLRLDLCLALEQSIEEYRP